MNTLTEFLGTYMGPLGIFLAKLAVVFCPLAGLAYWWRIFPHRPLFYLAMLPALVTLGMIFSPALLLPALLLDAVLAILAILDLFSLPRPEMFSATREMGRVASLRKDHPVTITLNYLGKRDCYVGVRDGAPYELHASPLNFSLRLDPQSRATLIYHVRSTRRGAFQMRMVHLRVRSRWGLWQRFVDLPASSALHVYPDLKQLGEYALLARTNRLSLLGVRRTRRIGQDNEFERLRDYTPDDNYKHIDWRSTARRSKLTVKDFQSNQSQRVVFLVDCGRMMTNEAAGLSLLDHALNAVLMLSYVALSHGDSVGLLCFSDEIQTYVPPAGGRTQMNRLLHASFDRFPKLVESRYDQAFLYLGAHCRKRSLVVLVTNVIDEVNANQIESYLATLVGKHLPLGVLLRDRQMFAAAEAHLTTEEQLYRAAAAADILTWRRQVISDLHNKGVLSLDTFPEEMTGPLISQYLAIKARHLL